MPPALPSRSSNFRPCVSAFRAPGEGARGAFLLSKSALFLPEESAICFRRQEAGRHQGHPRDHRSGSEGSEGSGRGLPEERQGGHLQGRCRETQGAAGCRRRYRRDQVISAHVYPHSAPRGKGRGVRSCCRKALFSCRKRALFARVGGDYRFPVRLGGLPSPPSAGSAGSSVR